jgi:hydrogenase maturation protein HypF
MDSQVVASPHIGDLSNIESVNAFHKTIDLLVGLYGGSVAKVICDLHPDYISTQVAESMQLPIIRVQHHLAHILACLLEHGGGPDKVLGVAWDGTGYGEDGTIWGGEFILVDRVQGTARRVAHLKPFPLPGGEVAVRQTARSALGALHAAGLLKDKNALVSLMKALRHDSIHVPLFMKAIEQRVNAPLTSSAGRLFDAAAALLDLAQTNTFEGQAGMAMEFAAEKAQSDASTFPWDLHKSSHQPGALEVDWSPMVKELCDSAQSGTNPNELSMRFHKTLAAMILKVAQSVGIETIVLTGGCFQNAILSDLTTDLLINSNFNVLLHHELSPNDNSISAGQAFAALLNITRVQT